MLKFFSLRIMYVFLNIVLCLFIWLSFNRRPSLACCVLNAIAAVKGVYRYPKAGYDPTDFNANRIVVKVKDGEGRVRTVTTPCTEQLPHWRDAAREAKRKVAEIIGESEAKVIDLKNNDHEINNVKLEEWFKQINTRSRKLLLKCSFCFPFSTCAKNASRIFI